MQLLLALLKQKKVLIIAGVLGLMFIVSIVFILLSQQKSSQENADGLQNQTSQATSQQTEKSFTFPKTARISTAQSQEPSQQAASTTGHVYDSATYAIAYPYDWSITTQPVAQGGSVTILKPSVLPAGVNYPRLTIEYDATNDPPIEGRESSYLRLGFKKTATTLGGLPAEKISGTFPTKDQGGVAVNSPIQTTTVYLAKNNAAYLVRYEYDGAAPNSQLEDYFTSYIQTFKFK